MSYQSGCQGKVVLGTLPETVQRRLAELVSSDSAALYPETIEHVLVLHVPLRGSLSAGMKLFAPAITVSQGPAEERAVSPLLGWSSLGGSRSGSSPTRSSLPPASRVPFARARRSSCTATTMSTASAPPRSSLDG